MRTIGQFESDEKMNVDLTVNGRYENTRQTVSTHTNTVTYEERV